MPELPIYIGIDAGTSGLRACAIDAVGKQLAEAREALPAPHRNGFAIEQDPGLWREALQRVLPALLAQIAADRVAALTIDGTSGTVLLTDARGEPLTPALMYNDARAGAQLEHIRQIAPPDSPVNARTAGLPKICWLAEHAERNRVAHVMHQADWLTCQFTRAPGHSDVNNCLKSGYDPLTHTWPTWLDALDLPRAWLPHVHTPGTPVATIHPAAARQFGLPEHTLIVSGTTDSHAAIVATGAQQVGEAVTSLGSTLVLKVISARPVFAAEFGVYSQPFGEHWLVGGASNSGGAMLRKFFTDAQLQTLSAQINADTASQLDYYPLPAPGERFPVNDPQLAPRLTPRPVDDATFLHGLLEGIARIERDGYRLLEQLGAPYPQSVRTVGGGAKNRTWTAIRGRLLNTAMLDTAHTEAAYGSALLAKQGYENRKQTVNRHSRGSGSPE